MTSIIGIDTHIATCDFYATSKEGKILGEGTIPTNATRLRQAVNSISGREKIVIIEQGPLANWLRRILRPHVTQVVVSETRRNRWIAKDPVKDDRFDAEKLVVLYRGGCIKEVIQREDSNEQLLRLVIQHHDLVRTRTRIKNKIKAKYRENGIRARGKTPFTTKGREPWLAQLSSNASLLFPTELLYQQLDLLDKQIKQADERLAETAKSYPIVEKLIAQFPAIGLITACTFVALIDTPERFQTVKKLWTYCGLGLDRRGSGLRPGMPHLTHRGNRLLKYMLKHAALSAVTNDKENRYRQWYEAALANGKADYKALLTCTRKLTKDMWLVWKASLAK